MADFERAFEISDLDKFIAARVAKLRWASERLSGRGDRYFLARQHAYFLLVYGECKCPSHSCGGCAITLGIAAELEKDLAAFDPQTVDREEAKASAGWTRVWLEWREFVRIVTARWERIKAERLGQTQRTRQATLRDAEREAGKY